MEKIKKINCPYCNEEAESGALEIHGTWTGWFLIGISYQNLYYKPFDEKYQEFSTNEEKVMKESEILKANKCKSCGAISFIPGKTII